MTLVELDLSRNRPIEVANMGYSRNGQLHPNRVTDYHDLLYITEGSWEVHEENHVFPLQPGDAVLLYQGRHHFGKNPCPPETHWIYIHFKSEPGDRFRDSGSDKRMPEAALAVRFPSMIQTPKEPRVATLFQEIVHCYWSSLQLNQIRARILLSELLIELNRIGSRDEDSASAGPIERVVRQIELRPRETLSLDELSELAGVSRRSLTRQFRQSTGKSIRQFQLDHKMRMARSLLTDNPGMKVKELAYLLGFCDSFHFSRVFRRLSGAWPSQFRS